MSTAFKNRAEAGQCLADRLMKFAGEPDLVVLALPRGGLPVGLEVARALDAPLDVFLVRKLGAPANAELAMGAVAEGGATVLNKHVIQSLRIGDEDVRRAINLEQEELARRSQVYRGDQPPASIEDKTVILVDDGLATGATMRVAVLAVRQQHPRRIVIAVPVAPPDTYTALRQDADEVVCCILPHLFMSVGSWYEDFGQISDEDARDILNEAREMYAAAASA